MTNPHEARARELLRLITQGGYLEYPARTRLVAEWLSETFAAVASKSRRAALEEAASLVEKHIPGLGPVVSRPMLGRIADRIRKLGETE